MVDGPEVGAVDDPVMFRQGGFRLVARMRGGDLRADEEQVGRLREFAQRQDGPADELVEWLVREPGNREWFEWALSSRENFEQAISGHEELRGQGAPSGHGTRSGRRAPSTEEARVRQEARDGQAALASQGERGSQEELRGQRARCGEHRPSSQGRRSRREGLGGREAWSEQQPPRGQAPLTSEGARVSREELSNQEAPSGQDAPSGGRARAGQEEVHGQRAPSSQDAPSTHAAQANQEAPSGQDTPSAHASQEGRRAEQPRQPPPELRKFLHTITATPYWVDRARVEKGARVVTRAGLLGLFPLGDMSLMGGYLASRATKALVGTGEIEYRATRRLVETAAWWMDVTTPGAMERGGAGFRAAVRVRVVHAYVRRAMNGRGDWDYERWDRPINQVQTAGTLLLFSLVYVFGTQLLGLRYTERERADVLHLWRYIGWLMGVDEELLPADEGDAWRLLWLLAATEFIPDEDSKRLAKALVESHAAIGEGRGAPGKVLAYVNVRVHSAISRLVLGKDNADFLELPDDPLAQAAVVAAAGVNFAAETARRLIPGATAVQELLGGLGRRRYLKRMHAVFNPDPSYGQHMRAA